MSTAAPYTADPSRAVPAHALVSLAGVQVAFGPTPALRGVDLVIEPGERVAIMGPSGCGKSTLLHVIAGVLAPDAGAVHVLGEEICAFSDRRRSRWRLGEVGMVFQFGDLIGELTLRENIVLPLDLLGAPRAESARRAAGLLERLDIAEVADRRAHEVSGGQAQRAAVARALAPEPALLLADEPTGALDSATASGVMEALTDSASDLGTGLVVVTHDNRVAAYLDRLITMRDGRVVG